MTLDSGFPRTVTVYGTGLIGCSFALALKQTIRGVRVLGIDTAEILHRARTIGAVDGNGTGSTEASDLVILSTPVGDILKLTGELQPGHSLILDVGSTKVNICKRAEE